MQSIVINRKVTAACQTVIKLRVLAKCHDPVCLLSQVPHDFQLNTYRRRERRTLLAESDFWSAFLHSAECHFIVNTGLHSQHVKCALCQNSMALPWVTDVEEGLQVWRVVANVKRSRQRKRGVPSDFGTRAGLRNSLEQNGNLQKVLGREKNSVLNITGSAEGNRLLWKICAQSGGYRENMSFNSLDGTVCTGFNWLRIETSGGSWLGKEVLAFSRGQCSMNN